MSQLAHAMWWYMDNWIQSSSSHQLAISISPNCFWSARLFPIDLKTRTTSPHRAVEFSPSSSLSLRSASWCSVKREFQVQWVVAKGWSVEWGEEEFDKFQSIERLTVVFFISSSGTSLSFTRFFQLFSPLSLSSASRSAIEPLFSDSWSKLGISSRLDVFDVVLFFISLLFSNEKMRWKQEQEIRVPSMSKSTARLRWWKNYESRVSEKHFKSYEITTLIFLFFGSCFVWMK